MLRHFMVDIKTRDDGILKDLRTTKEKQDLMA
jgi:hypothetical protein